MSDLAGSIQKLPVWRSGQESWISDIFSFLDWCEGPILIEFESMNTLTELITKDVWHLESVGANVDEST